MLIRQMSRLATTVTAAGAACAIGAAPAAAAPQASWTRLGAAPHVFTNATPGLSQIFLTGTGSRGTIMVWKGQLGNAVKYETKISGHWSAAHVIPGARTSAGPSVGFYTDPASRDAVLVVWKKLHSSAIQYAQGETHRNGSISWTAPKTLLPAETTARTITAPSVFFPVNALDRVIVAWQGPHHHVRYSVGNASGRDFRWASSHLLSSAPATTTSSAPALAEVRTSSTQGTLYLIWRDRGTSTVSYATAGDPLHGQTLLPWSAPATVPGAATTASPAASSVDQHGTGPLMIAYKGAHGLGVRYQELISGSWTAPANVPQASTAIGPSLLTGLLATVSPNSSGNVILHLFS